MIHCGSAECTACAPVKAVVCIRAYIPADGAVERVPLCAQRGGLCTCIGAAWQVVAIDASIALEDADNRAREQLKYGSDSDCVALVATLEDIRRILNEALADYRLVADVLERAEGR